MAGLGLEEKHLLQATNANTRLRNVYERLLVHVMAHSICVLCHEGRRSLATKQMRSPLYQNGYKETMCANTFVHIDRLPIAVLLSALL